MSIEDKILEFLLKPKYRYNGMNVSALGIPIFLPYRRQSVVNALLKLSKRDFIRRDGDSCIMLRPNGLKYIESRSAQLKLFDRKSFKYNKKKLLVLFDIPEDRKTLREWFRKQLIGFGYDMVQKSVWLGPGPLPQEFIEYIKEIGLKDYIRIFTITSSTEAIL